MSSTYRHIIILSLAWTTLMYSSQVSVVQNEKDKFGFYYPSQGIEEDLQDDVSSSIISYGTKAIQSLLGFFKPCDGALQKTPLILKAVISFLVLQNGAKALSVSNINQTLPYDGQIVVFLPMRISTVLPCNATLVIDDKNSGTLNSSVGALSSIFSDGVWTAQGDPNILSSTLSNFGFFPVKGHRARVNIYSTITELGVGGERVQGIIQLNPSGTNVFSTSVTRQSLTSQDIKTTISKNIPSGTSLEDQSQSTESNVSIDQKTTTGLSRSSDASIPLVIPSSKPPYEIIGGVVGAVFLTGIIAAAVVAVKRGWCGLTRMKSSSDQPHNNNLGNGDNYHKAPPPLNQSEYQVVSDCAIKPEYEAINNPLGDGYQHVPVSKMRPQYDDVNKHLDNSGYQDVSISAIRLQYEATGQPLT